MDKMVIYNRLPVFAQNLACCYEGWKIKRTRYSKEFWKYLAEYEARANWSYEQLCDFRDARLRRMIHHCYETVPYYTKLFNDGGINPDSIKTLDDIKVLPVLTKDIVKNKFNDFISTSVPSKGVKTFHTSGTTGSGFIFKTTEDALREQWAVWWRYRRRLGIKFDAWCALFGGRSVVPVDRSISPFYRINAPCRQIYFSTYHMNDMNMQSYIDSLNKYKLEWIHGYPSAIALLAEYILVKNITQKHKVQFVTTGAENLLEQQKEKIYSAFGVMPYQHYGMAEGVANFSQDTYRKMYVDEDYAAVEFMGKNDGTEVIGTTLTNYAMPLLRYKVGDLASIHSTADGREITSVDGRNEDYVILPDGARVGRLDHIFKDMVNVKEAQIIQREVGKIEVRIVKGTEYTERDETTLIQEIQIRLHNMKVVINYVDKIPRTKNGKLRFVVSEITEGWMKSNVV